MGISCKATTHTALRHANALKTSENKEKCTTVYTDLSEISYPTQDDISLAQRYLIQQLQAAADLDCDLPIDPAELVAWSHMRAEQVGRLYRDYLAGRRCGATRQFFRNQSHALYFLRCVAPTKLVDGAWLYGALGHWEQTAYAPLIKTYLEELGNGVPDKNHVVLYQRLLDLYGLALLPGQNSELSAAHFTQGAIQLALAYGGERYLPEMIGYNLGYEQLPLHLLITSYELNELGIDPYYFSLHVTVDNGASGHAYDAIDALHRLLPHSGDVAAFYRRVRAGYRLNDLGESTASVIAAFKLEDELVRILGAKSLVGKNMHADYCRIAGRSINEWLAERTQIPALLRALETNGWIVRGAAPAESRFWRLIQGERAEMFEFFSVYEQQVLADWISQPLDPARAPAAARIPSHRARLRALMPVTTPVARSGTPRPLIRYNMPQPASPFEENGGIDGLRHIEQQIAQAPDKAAAMQLLLPWLSPNTHHGAVGLMATRMFTRLRGY